MTSPSDPELKPTAWYAVYTRTLEPEPRRRRWDVGSILVIIATTAALYWATETWVQALTAFLAKGRWLP